jgi:hypothetical protein
VGQHIGLFLSQILLKYFLTFTVCKVMLNSYSLKKETDPIRSLFPLSDENVLDSIRCLFE